MEPSTILLGESRLSPYGHYLCNNYILFVIFGYLWTLLVRVCGINDPGHTCDGYLVLLYQSRVNHRNTSQLEESFP
jgi:hypothetical protein